MIVIPMISHKEKGDLYLLIKKLHKEGLSLLSYQSVEVIIFMVIEKLGILVCLKERSFDVEEIRRKRGFVV